MKDEAMKLTVTQLRSIIREEVKKATLGKKNLSEGVVRIAEDKVTLKEGHSRITQEELSAWKTGNLEFVSEVGSMSTGMRRKVDPDFHLKAALKRVPSFIDIDVNIDVDMLQWFQAMSDEYYSEDLLLSDFNRDWDIPGVTLEDIKNIQLAMIEDNKRLDKRSSYELG